jgi:uncharacterized LabA/DUF88 family protein
MTSDELRRQADSFEDLSDLQTKVGRPRAAHGSALPKFLHPDEDFDDAV